MAFRTHLPRAPFDRNSPFFAALLRSLGSIALLAGCESKGNGAPGAPEASLDASSRDASLGDASRDAQTSAARPLYDSLPDAGKVALTPLSDADKSAYDAFRKAMAEARELTHKKNYAGAIKAYDGALVAMPNDPRALGERGYARLDAKDYTGALRDLEAARVRAPTPDLEAQIWFNIGTAEEALGHAEAARGAYVQVQNRRPSAAAAKHLIGLSQCDARIDRDVHPAKIYASWLAAFKGFEAAKIAAWKDGATPKPSTNDDAQKAICGDACTGSGPWIAEVGDPSVAAEFALVSQGDAGKVVVFHHLGDAASGRCTYADDVVLDPASKGTPIAHVRVKSAPSSRLFVRTDSLGEIKECEVDVAVCQSACMTETWTDRDSFFDLGARAQILRVEQSGRPNGASQARTVLIGQKADAIHIHGGGCDLTVPTTVRDGGP